MVCFKLVQPRLSPARRVQLYVKGYNHCFCCTYGLKLRRFCLLEINQCDFIKAVARVWQHRYGSADRRMQTNSRMIAGKTTTSTLHAGANSPCGGRHLHAHIHTKPGAIAVAPRIDCSTTCNRFSSHFAMSDEAAASGEAHVADRRDTVDVFVQVPPDTADADVTVSGGADALQVQVKDAPQPLLSIMQLYSTVDPALTSWRIDDSQLVISLHKRDASLRWPGLNAMREEPESQQVLSLSMCADQCAMCSRHACMMHACCEKVDHAGIPSSQMPEPVRHTLPQSAWRRPDQQRRWRLRRRRKCRKELVRRCRSAAGCGTCCRPPRTATWTPSRHALDAASGLCLPAFRSNQLLRISMSRATAAAIACICGSGLRDWTYRLLCGSCIVTPILYSACVQTAARHYGGSDVGRVRDGNGRTVLHFAAQVAQLAMCSYLLDERQMDVNVQDDRGEQGCTMSHLLLQKHAYKDPGKRANRWCMLCAGETALLLQRSLDIPCARVLVSENQIDRACHMQGKRRCRWQQARGSWPRPRSCCGKAQMQTFAMRVCNECYRCLLGACRGDGAVASGGRWAAGHGYAAAVAWHDAKLTSPGIF